MKHSEAVEQVYHRQRLPIKILEPFIAILYGRLLHAEDEHRAPFDHEDFLLLWVRSVVYGVETEPGEAVVVLDRNDEEDRLKRRFKTVERVAQSDR